jgi:hypothetical protein
VRQGTSRSQDPFFSACALMGPDDALTQHASLLLKRDKIAE